MLINLLRTLFARDHGTTPDAMKSATISPRETAFAAPADTAALYHPARYFLTPAFVSGHPAGYSRAR